MERSFSHLLRTSRLASYDKNIAQIYTTTGKAKAIGDWGLKRNLPKVLKTHLVYVDQLDTVEHQTPFRSASSDYLFIQRWKENFPRSRQPQPQPVKVKKDLASMSNTEFKHLVQSAKQQRQKWKQALANNELKPDDYLQFMDVVSTLPKEPSLYSFSSSRSDSHSNNNPGSHKVGPTYGFFEPAGPVVVQGRGLGGKVRSTTQVIGISGVVASLAAYSNEPLSKSLKSVYVYKAEFASDGRPDVKVGFQPQPPSWNPYTGKDSGFSSSRQALDVASSAASRIDHNSPPGGQRAMTRVQDLLSVYDKSSTRV